MDLAVLWEFLTALSSEYIEIVAFWDLDTVLCDRRKKYAKDTRVIGTNVTESDIAGVVPDCCRPTAVCARKTKCVVSGL
jgi:hypothetical protein